MLLKRIVTVLIGAPFVVAAIIWPATAVFKVFCVGCLAVSLWEYFTIIPVSKAGRVFGTTLGVLHILTLFFAPAAWNGPVWESALLVLLVFGFYCFSRREAMEGIAQRIALTLLGILYVGTFGAFVGLTRDLPNGVFWVFVLLGMTWLNDTFAYFFGHRFGKRKLAPMISPGKTVEGFLGGFLGSFCGFLLFWVIFRRPISILYSAPLTLLVGVVGPVGDLCESLIKRSFNIKDSGNVIPGHGGMLDRIDALLFTAPVVYWYAHFL